MHTSEYPNGVVVNMPLKQIELDTRKREIREAQAAHAAMRPRGVTPRLAAKNAAIIFVAFGCAAFILWELVIAPVIDGLTRVFGQ